MTTIEDSPDIFSNVIKKLGEIYALPKSDKPEVAEVLGRLAEAVHEVELTYNAHCREANVLSVERATIIGGIYLWVKSSLLHGQWTEWAAEIFTESLRTLEKFMAIAKSSLAREFAHLGTEKLYHLTRVEHLLSEKGNLPDLFQACELDPDFASYTGKGMERAVTVILNKEVLREHEIDLPNEALFRLSENFRLVKDSPNVLARLCEAKSEEANLDKVVTNIIASGGKTDKKQKRSSAKNMKEDVNAVAERFIRSLQAAMETPGAPIDENRLKFVLKLVTECLTVRCHKA